MFESPALRNLMAFFEKIRENNSLVSISYYQMHFKKAKKKSQQDFVQVGSGIASLVPISTSTYNNPYKNTLMSHNWLHMVIYHCSNIIIWSICMSTIFTTLPVDTFVYIVIQCALEFISTRLDFQLIRLGKQFALNVSMVNRIGKFILFTSDPQYQVTISSKQGKCWLPLVDRKLVILDYGSKIFSRYGNP